MSDIIASSTIKREFSVIAKEETIALEMLQIENPNKVSFDNCENCTNLPSDVTVLISTQLIMCLHACMSIFIVMLITFQWLI